MKVETTSLEGVLKITPPTTQRDARGGYVEIYNERLYREAGIDVTFVEDDFSYSSRNVLRGLHGDRKTWKLISCLHGRFYMVVVDCREEKPTFGSWESFDLSEDNHLQILVPPGFGNGHVAMTEKVIFHYKQSSYYDRKSQFTYLWNDPRLKIAWPIRDPILSRRDQGLADA